MPRILALLALCLPLPALADGATLSLELNGAETVEAACRLTFLVENRLGADLSRLALETVILTADRRVERLTLFDLREVPMGRPRVRQFDLAGLGCEGVGAVLINGVADCAGADPAACAAGLTLTSRVDGMEVLG